MVGRTCPVLSASPFHPVFLGGADGAKAPLTVGALADQCNGGAMPDATPRDGMPFIQAQRSRRYDVGLTAKTPLEGICSRRHCPNWPFAIQVAAIRIDLRHTTAQYCPRPANG
jgi:hypothetical protein